MQPEKKTFTLLELASSIQRAIHNIYNANYWVKAEMYKLNKSSKGHCYPELVYKENDVILAEMRGMIWSKNFEQIRLKFEEVVKEPFRDGLTLLFQVKVVFHPLYGMSLDIVDIDPNYTLGELQKEREETLKKLIAKGILNKNQSLKLSLLPKNIAVISVESSKGLSDFMTVLESNPYNYGFNTKLFSAVLNGDGAIESIQKQLLLISKYTSFFDAVVIVRGGGGEIGMTCYNNYQLCETIANFPLPILTGIGHSTNMTVAEMIAYKSTITPTELAGFFVERFRKFELSVLDTLNKIIAETRYLLVQTKKELVSESRVFRNVSFASLINNKQKSEQVNIDLKRTSLEALKKENLFLIDEVKQFKNTLNWIHKAEISKLENTTRQVDSTSKRLLFNKNAMLLDLRVYLNNKIPRVLDENKTQLTKYESMIKLVHPDTILKKGYTISLVNGRAISEANPVQIGDEIKTITAFTEFLSRVEIVKKT